MLHPWRRIINGEQRDLGYNKITQLHKNKSGISTCREVKEDVDTQAYTNSLRQRQRNREIKIKTSHFLITTEGKKKPIRLERRVAHALKRLLMAD